MSNNFGDLERQERYTTVVSSRRSYSAVSSSNGLTWTPLMDQLSADIQTKGVLYSRDNPWWHRMRDRSWRGPTPDSGGPFWSSQSYYSENIREVDTFPKTGILKSAFCYRGPLFPAWYRRLDQGAITPPVTFLPIEPNGSKLSALLTAGATAISRCAPTQPATDSLVALGELYNEGIPKLSGAAIKEATKNYKDLAKAGSSEYLNVEFGWKPFIAELRGLAKTIQEEERILNQLVRNNGKSVRRRYKFPLEETVTETLGTPRRSYFQPGLNTHCYDEPSGTSHTIRTVSKETWFSGEFQYYTSLEGSTSWERAKATAAKARHLYGIKLTPDVLWNLTPWTWALDWVGNMGDVIENVSLLTQDGLVMRYGYVMRTERISDRVSIRGVRLKRDPKPLDDLWQEFGVVTKYRLKASPYGFGLDWDGFSPRQLAIMAALGISRS